MRNARAVALLTIGVFLLTAICWTQTSTTSLRGLVTDPAGAVLPGASVTLTNPSSGFSQSTTTARDGVYQFLQVPPATYTVTVSAPGFATVKNTNVVLQVSLPATLNVTMSVQGRSETVEIKGNAPPVNTQDATLGNAFDRTQIEALPFEGRNPVEILSLQPGVTFIAPSGVVDQVGDRSHPGDSRGGSVNGARSDQTNVTLDGLDNNDQLLGLAFTGALRTTLESIEEFRVTTSNANADAGRSSGAQVSLVTKSGTNNFHGSLYEYHRPTFTTANDWFNKRDEIAAKLPNRPGLFLRNTFGASVGGPILKDRLFFFAAYEGMRKSEAQQITRVVPSDLLRQGTIQYIACSNNPSDPKFSDPNSCGAGDPGNVTVALNQAQIASISPAVANPANIGVDPAVVALFQQYPHPNNDSVGDGLNFRGFSFSAPFPVRQNTWIVKLDYNLTNNGNHRLFLRGNLQDDHTSNPPQFPGMPPNYTLTDNSRGLAAGYTAVLRNNLVNNFRWGFVRQGLGTAGLSNQPVNQFRILDDLRGFTRSTFVTVPVHNFVDDVTWTKGKHTLQFGGNWRLIHNNRASNAQNFFNGLANVSWLDKAAIANAGTDYDPAHFGFPAVATFFTQSYDTPMASLAGLMTQITATYNQDKSGNILPQGSLVGRHFKSNEFETYVQDQWRVTPTFTVVAGLRYSLLQPPYETHGDQVAPTISMNDWFRRRGQAMLAGQSYSQLITIDTSGQANGKKPYWNWDYKDIAPRLAIAWSPSSETGWKHALFGGSGKTSIRAGYGLYYDHFGEGVVNTFDRQGSFGLTTQELNPAAVVTVDDAPRFTSLYSIPTADLNGNSLLAPPPGKFPVTPPGADQNGGFAIYWGLDDKLKTPYSHVIDFSITRELPKNFVVEAAYVGRLAHRLLQEEDLAMPLNLFDPKSGMDYFTAATMLTKAANAGVDIRNVAPIPFWQDVFPTAAGNFGFGPPGDPANLGCAPGNSTFTGKPTATQAMYDMYSCFAGNETTALFVADLLGLPGFATVNGVTGPTQLFDGQFSSLYAWRSIGNSSYHGLQLMLKRRMTSGLQFDFNYTLSKSIDIGSNAERINEFEGFGFASQVINSWSPKQLRAVSDFDTRHQINSNWTWELPFGIGRRWGSSAHGAAEALLGGWQISGLFRWSSGLPFTIGPGLGFWATNWQLTSAAVLNGSAPKTGTFIDSGGNPNVFKDPAAAVSAFRFAYPGESGQRNELRGPGYFGIDSSLSKSWKIQESKELTFRWEVFNVTNSVRFDVGTMSFNNASISTASTFGRYTQTLTRPRIMQFALRFAF
ncbi:MAG TPA: carboxypeptidase-like regulatory domain-containing protein [Terriglobales bacterium]|nr:carboxypeptidase-like regulatory domain-containing protein [Terriglobales bacterium]